MITILLILQLNMTLENILISSNGKKFEIITVQEGKSILEQYNLTLHENIGISAFQEFRLRIFNVSNKSLLVMPSDYNNFPSGECNIAYIFYDIKSLEECIRNEKFPKECSPARVFQKYQEYLININNKETELYDYILTNLDIDISDHIKITDVEKIYNSLESAFIYDFEENFILTAHAISLFIKRHKKAKWILIKERGEYNKYFIPGLMDEFGNIWMIFHQLERFKAKSPKQKDSGFKFFNDFALKQIFGKFTTENLKNSANSITEPFIVLD